VSLKASKIFFSINFNFKILIYKLISNFLKDVPY